MTNLARSFRAASTHTATLLSVLAVPIAAVTAQRAPERLVSTEWLQQHRGEARLVIIHASSQKSDYLAGHVPGARWLAWQAFTTSRDGLSTELPDAATIDSALEMIGVSDEDRIIIAGGPITTTARLFFTLDYFGLGDRVSLLDGGIDAWREEGRPVEQADEPPRRRGSLTLRPQPAKLWHAQSILAVNPASGGRVKVLDARVPEFFAGLATNNTPRAGRLPNAQNIPFTWITGELTRFRDRGKLERLFAQAGVQAGDTVVTYCHVGIQASLVYLAARLLGYEAGVYDGSFEDWSRRSELPVSSNGPPRPPDR